MHRYLCGTHEVYHLTNDPGETRDLAADPPFHVRVCELRGQYSRAMLRAINPGRLTHASSYGEIADRVEARLDTVVEMLDRQACGDTLTGRIGDVAADIWMPDVIMLTELPPPASNVNGSSASPPAYAQPSAA